MADLFAKDIRFDLVFAAIARVRERLIRAGGILRNAGITFAVSGDQAAIAWIASADESCIRNAQQVQFLVPEGEMKIAEMALIQAGFKMHTKANKHVFLDAPFNHPRHSVEIRTHESPLISTVLAVAPYTESKIRDELPYMHMQSLVEMQLTDFLTNNRVNIRDLIDAGLVDATWPDRFQPILAERLREILADPDG